MVIRSSRRRRPAPEAAAPPHEGAPPRAVSAAGATRAAGAAPLNGIASAAGAREGGILAAAAAAAEHWLAGWLRAGAGSGEPPDMREFNAAVTALRRLIDVRKALREWEHDLAERLDGEYPSPVAERVFQGFEADGLRDEADGDPDPLPD